MATPQDAIQRLQIETTSPGTEEATASLNKLAEAYGGVAVASASTEKATASLDSKFASIERRYVDGVKAQQDYAKIQKTVNAAVAQNPALTERANAVLAAAKQRYEDLTHSQSSYEKSVEAIKDKASELTHELGPAGAALRAIGPVGIAVGAAIGVAVLAMDKLKEQANEAGQWAAQLQNAANIIGLNTTELQALNEVASTVGVSAVDNVTAFERFSVSLGQLRDGTGSLYTELLKVNPALVNQLSVTKDAATGWNLLSQAYAQADKQQQALIARAAFGKSGAAEGGVLLATARAGGISGLANEDAISQKQIQQWAELTTKINSATEAAQHNFQSIFTDKILQNQLDFANGMLKISQSAREFAMSEDLKGFIDFITNPIVGGILFGTAVGAAGGALIGGVGAIPGAVAGAVAGGIAGATTNSITNYGANARAQAQSALPPAPNFDATFEAVSKSNAATSVGSLGVQATQAKALVSALGPAATAQEKLDATTKQLNIDLANHVITQETYNRALAGAKLDAVVTQQNAYNAALGASAGVEDLVAARMNQIAKLQQQGAGLTAQQIADQRSLAEEQARGVTQMKAQTDALTVQTATVGMSAGQAAAYTAEQNRLNEALRNHQVLTAADVAAIHEQAQALGDATQASAQKTAQDRANFELQTALLGDTDKQIAQMQQQLHGNAWAEFMNDGLAASTRLSSSLKTLSSTIENELVSGLSDIVSGTKSVGQGAADMANAVVKAIEQMIIKIAIIQPMMQALQLGANSLGLGSGIASLIGGGGTSAAAASVSTALPTTGLDLLAAIHHTGGVVGAAGMPSRYVHSAYFDDAKRMHTGGIVGDEVPIIAKKGEVVGWPDQLAAAYGGGARGGGASAPQVTVNVVNAPAGVKSQTSQTDANGNTRIDVVLNKAVDEAVGKSLSTGTGRRVLGNQYGIKQFTGQ